MIKFKSLKYSFFWICNNWCPNNLLIM